jgi:hypothetical protein
MGDQLRPKRNRRVWLQIGVAMVATALLTSCLLARPPIVRYTIYEVGAHGRRKPLASGVLQCDSKNLHSLELNVLWQHFWKKWFTLEKGFAIGGGIHREKTLSGFGLWISKDGGGFSWDWFTLDTGLVYRKLQGTGRVKVTFVPNKDYQELASVEFLDDVTLRGYFSWAPFVMTHQVEVQKGSVLRFSP